LQEEAEIDRNRNAAGHALLKEWRAQLARLDKPGSGYELEGDPDRDRDRAVGIGGRHVVGAGACQYRAITRNGPLPNAGAKRLADGESVDRRVSKAA
jgi:hypothetical protein